MRTEIIDDDENVLRRIHQTFYRRDLPIPVSRAAFEPNKNDIDGLSVFRAEFITPERLVLDRKEPTLYCVAALPVLNLRRLSLTVLSAEIDNLPGHAIIPELAYSAYQANKHRLKEILVELARLVSTRIVFGPSVVGPSKFER